ncbi:MAG TPA: hypothetical protein VD883_04370, partial [Candidatus Omnitrophota bacterium]|nr:hypothetical protein [Candidatus Omnitrophota bacterium]
PKPELEKLILQALQYKQNKITPGSFHLYLSKIAQGQDVDPLAYKNVILYSQYVVLYEAIDLIRIFEEVEAFETKIKETLFSSSEERELSRTAHTVRLLAKLLDTSLTSSEYDFFRGHEKDFNLSLIREIIGRSSAKHSVVDDTDFSVLERAIPDARAFYQKAHQRNEVMLENTVRRMKENKVQVAALVTGGFHSEGISELMDRQKLSYLVVMPKFDHKSPTRPYIAILTQRPKEYEESFKDSDFYIAAASFSDLSGILPHSAKVEHAELSLAVAIKHWRQIGRSGETAFSSEALEAVVGRYTELYLQNGGRGILTPDHVSRTLKNAVVEKRGPEGYAVYLGENVYVFEDDALTISPIRAAEIPSVSVPVAKLKQIEQALSQAQEAIRSLSAEDIALKMRSAAPDSKKEFVRDDVLRAVRRMGYAELDAERIDDVLKAANAAGARLSEVEAAKPETPVTAPKPAPVIEEKKEETRPDEEKKVEVPPVTAQPKKLSFADRLKGLSSVFYALLASILIPILSPVFNWFNEVIRGEAPFPFSGIAPAPALVIGDFERVARPQDTVRAEQKLVPPQTLVFPGQVYENVPVAVEKGLAIETTSPQELIERRHPDRQPRHLFKEDERGFPVEPAGTGWSRRWVLLTDRDDNFVSVNVYDGDKPLFALTGNVLVNGEPIEKWAKRGGVLSLKDKISFEMVTRYVFEDKTMPNAPTGTITSSVNTRTGVSYNKINPNEADSALSRKGKVPRLDLPEIQNVFPWTGDIEQRINRGKSADGKFIVSEIRTYQKNANGEILFENGRPRYYARFEYYDEWENLRYTINGVLNPKEKFEGHLLSVVDLELSPEKVKDRWKVKFEDT